MKSKQDMFQIRSVQTFVTNTHTVRFMSIEAADTRMQIDFNCCDHSYCCVDLFPTTTPET
jgi:hypothetical protein